MDRYQGQNTAQRLVGTPHTDAARFTITKVDVGSEAVRAGVAAELERERNMLLAASKMALAHIRNGRVAIGAAQEFALEQAIRLAEMPK